MLSTGVQSLKRLKCATVEESNEVRHGGQQIVARGPSLREAITIPGPAGQLEALLEEPKELREQKVAVLCHPHPQYQGTMLNKVVHTLARSMNDLGSASCSLQFSWRWRK